MSEAKVGLKAVIYQNQIWAIGGNSGVDSQVVESYDPESNQWTSQASLTRGRKWPSAWVVNDRIYAAGGFNAPAASVEIEQYDPLTQTWVLRIRCRNPSVHWTQ